METVKNNQGWVLVGVALIMLAGVFALNAQQTAQGSNVVAAEEQTAEQQAEAASEETEVATPQYNYVAQDGDSYSVLARKAVQTYGIVNNVNLSQAQIVAAETFLTQQASEPWLSVGETVVMAESDVKTAVEQAQALSAEQQAAWQAYAVDVDFNTDRNGQA